DRQRETVHRQLGQRDSLHTVLRNPDGVKRDIDRGGLIDDTVEVARYGLLVERVDLRGFHLSAGSRDFFGECVEGLKVSSGKKYARAFASEHTGHRAPDRAPGAIDDRVLVFEQHHVRSLHRHAALLSDALSASADGEVALRCGLFSTGATPVVMSV